MEVSIANYASSPRSIVSIAFQNATPTASTAATTQTTLEHVRISLHSTAIDWRKRRIGTRGAKFLPINYASPSQCIPRPAPSSSSCRPSFVRSEPSSNVHRSIPPRTHTPLLLPRSSPRNCHRNAPSTSNGAGHHRVARSGAHHYPRAFEYSARHAGSFVVAPAFRI